MTKTFCYLPWIFQGTRTNGHLRVCCAANSGPNKGSLTKNDGTEYRIGQDSLTESRNSQTLKEVRKAMLEGKWHPVCTRCKQEEDSGIESRRILEQRHWEDLPPQDLTQRTSPDGTISTDDVPVKFYELRLGNQCNLKCRSCNPTESSAWYDDHVKLYERETFSDTQGKVELKLKDGSYRSADDSYNWMNNSQSWQDLKVNIDDLELLYLVGGEPLLINKH